MWRHIAAIIIKMVDAIELDMRSYAKLLRSRMTRYGNQAIFKKKTASGCFDY